MANFSVKISGTGNNQYFELTKNNNTFVVPRPTIHEVNSIRDVSFHPNVTVMHGRFGSNPARVARGVQRIQGKVPNYLQMLVKTELEDTENSYISWYRVFGISDILIVTYQVGTVDWSYTYELVKQSNKYVPTHIYVRYIVDNNIFYSGRSVGIYLDGRAMSMVSSKSELSKTSNVAEYFNVDQPGNQVIVSGPYKGI